MRLGPGDLLVAYTDGITEPENAYGEMFGEERLRELLAKNGTAIRPRSSRAPWRPSWSGPGDAAELSDDMTMLVARRP